MMMPSDVWLAIATYRDFYDFPRLVLVADREAGFWILDSEFDDERDEYSDSYKVYYAGKDQEQAYARFAQHANGTVGTLIGAAPITRLEFDPTRRRELILKGQ